MFTFRLILVYALVAQLGAGYRCCPSNAPCSLPDSNAACCVAGSCGLHSAHKSCCEHHSERNDTNEPGDEEHGSSCPCCSEHRLGSKKPMDGVPAPELLNLPVMGSLSLAPLYDQLPSDNWVVRWEVRTPRARPTISRLAQLSVWRT